MYQSKQMADLVAELLNTYEATTTQYGLSLALTMSGQGHLIIEELTPQVLMRIAYVFFDRGGNALMEPEILFYVGEGDWIPYELRRTTTGQQSYGDLHPLTGELAIHDESGQQALAGYADWFASGVREQGWLSQAHKVPFAPGGVPRPSAPMQELVQGLANRYGVDLSHPDAYLRLEMADRADCLVLQRTGRHISLARYVTKHGVLTPDPDMVFCLEQPAIWPVVEVIYSWQEWQAYVAWAQQQGIPLADIPRAAVWANFAEYWATQLNEQGWPWFAHRHDDTVSRFSALDPSTWPEPTEPMPDEETLMAWFNEEGGCEATDGCWVEADSCCEHGHPSWMLVAGLV